MARKCKISGKGPMAGNNVSFSQKKTRRRFLPNLQTKKIYVPELDRTVSIRMSARALRTVDKVGLMAYLNKEGLKLQDVI
ncbi:MAG: 50S ribosomal protein L28 [Chloroflexi bacterium]|nr:50S ribosomal protein L28 [Ardenticatenaceae bacterium]MBL1126910.1 50S ribosomal protein L28 [Chloroflexota bacterium]NOG32966.1 50S ribosomal protein L28 [Chloroflexota bacterium]